MSPEVLLYLLVGWQPLPSVHPPGFPYPQLPADKICELCYQQCEADRQRIDQVLAQFEVDYWHESGSFKQRVQGGGWLRERLQDQRQQADRLAAIWYAAWWVSWPRSTPEQREEWAGVLACQIGVDAFWRGEMPLPLGCR